MTTISTKTTTPKTNNDSRVWALSAPLEVVTFDIYRDIHKGIRAELFAVTGTAGAVDPHDDTAVRQLAGRVHALAKLLESHANLEDAYLAPLVTRKDPDLAAAIATDHVELEGQMSALAAAFDALPASSGPARRQAAHRVYLGLASFCSDYLEHQAVEELEVMPALATGYTLAELLQVNGEMISTMPPEKIAATLALLLPAMNVEDRSEMLGGMKASAPAEAFQGVMQLAGQVLSPRDYAALAARVG